MPIAPITSRINHNPIDNSVACLEAEELDYDDWRFRQEVERAMEWRPLEWLRLHYPELTFANVATRAETKGHLFKVTLGRHRYRVADWRTA